MSSLLTFTIPFQEFESITGWHPQCCKITGSMNHQQLASGYALDVLETLDRMTVEEHLSI
jgi:hypothetical protein